MRVGILGGGQLGRMLALAGIPLGMRFRCFEPAEEACAAAVAEHVRADYDDEAALARFADGLDVITYEFENVPLESARFLASRVPHLYPPPRALEVSQDRLTEKQFLNRCGVPTAAFEAVDSEADLERAVASIGLPAVLKSRRLGYDGKGQVVLRTSEDVPAARQQLGGAPLILEGFVPFDRELSILAVRGRDGAIACYPLVENHHREGILRLSLAPAPRLTAVLQTDAEAKARAVLEALDYVGVLAIELFEHDGRLIANEMAPRVHNSGHWSIEGAATSQFENHVRACAGLPLSTTKVRGHTAMVNLIGSVPDLAPAFALPETHVHLYGKTPREGRKLGHITLRAADPATIDERLAGLGTAGFDAKPNTAEPPPPVPGEGGGGGSADHAATN